MTECRDYLEANFPHITFRRDWSISSKTMFQLGECHALIDTLRYLPLSNDLRQKLLQVSLIKGAMATTAIEGNTLTEKEALDIINNKSQVPPSRKYQETELRNVIEAMNAIFDDVGRHNLVAPVTKELLCSFNQMVGKDLGDSYDGIPGRVRQRFVAVGNYHAPNYKYLDEILDRFTDWLQREFHFSRKEKPDFVDSIVEAIVAHVYIAWIHPFCDGNGRTARLTEFYILLRAGFPNICSHILSNFYNSTRSRYYQEIINATKTRSISAFIAYAVEGLRDGLDDVMKSVTNHQLYNAWHMTSLSAIEAIPRTSAERKERLRTIVKIMSLSKKYTIRDIVATLYTANGDSLATNERNTARDVKTLLDAGVFEKEGDQYGANLKAMVDLLPERRPTPEE